MTQTDRQERASAIAGLRRTLNFVLEKDWLPDAVRIKALELRVAVGEKGKVEDRLIGLSE